MLYSYRNTFQKTVRGANCKDKSYKKRVPFKRITSILVCMSVLSSTMVSSFPKLTFATEEKISYSQSQLAEATNYIPGEFVEGEVIVKFKNGQFDLPSGGSQGEISTYSIKESPDYTIEQTWNFNSDSNEEKPSLNTYSIRSANEESGLTMALVKSETLSTAQLIDELEKQDNIAYAEPNYIYHTNETDPHTTGDPNDTSFDEQWGLDVIGVDSIWNQGVTGDEEIVIAVLDTGVDYEHEDLNDNMWKDDNGHHGYNSVNLRNPTLYPMDDHGHGTHCAGILGAEGNNGIGISGVNQNIKIMALKFLDSEGYGTTDSAISAYEYMLKAKKAGVNLVAVNNSWGGAGYAKNMLDVINELGKEGVLSICAAGNEANNNDVNINSPCGLDSPYIISVASIGDPEETIKEDRVKDLSSFSNYGRTTVDVAAPGGAIYSTVPINKDTDGNKDGYIEWSGTSMATPFITGSVALLKAYSDEKGKGWDINEIKARILGGTIKKKSLKGKTLSDGYFNLEVAIDDTKIMPVLNSPPSYDAENNSITIQGYFFGESGKITIDGKECTTTSWSNKEITATLPNNISSGMHNFTVTNNNGNSGRNDFEIDLPNQAKFEELDPIPTGLSFKQTVTSGRMIGIGDYIYHIGGTLFPQAQNSDDDKSIYRYSINTGKWGKMTSKIPSIPADYFLPACAVDETIYMFATTALTLTPYIYTYDTKTDKCVSKELTSLPEEFYKNNYDNGLFTYDSSIVYKDGKIWVAGGTTMSYQYKALGQPYTTGVNPSKNFFTINPSNETVEKKTSLPTGIYDPQMHIVGGKLVLVGLGDSTIKTFIYDEDRDEWTAGATFPKLISQTFSLASGIYDTDKIICTGIQTSEFGDTVVYDVDKNEWSSAGVQLSGGKLNKLVGTCHNGYLYAMGVNSIGELEFKRTKLPETTTTATEPSTTTSTTSTTTTTTSTTQSTTNSTTKSTTAPTQITTNSTTKSTSGTTQSTLAPTKTTTTTSTQPTTTTKLTTTTITEPTTTRPITPTKPNPTETENESNSKSGFVKEGIDENGFDAWYYYEDNGIKASGWREIDGHMYYFNPDNDNLMQTGWLKTKSGDWYYFDVNVYRKSTRLSSPSEGLGRMHTGWANDGGNEWYYLDAVTETFEKGRGKQVLGWVNDGGQDWYYYDKEEGELAINWELIDGKWYFFSDDENNIATYGQMQRGWQFIDGAWYYLGISGETDGEMLVGWQVIDGFYYYFYEDGDMAVNIVIDRYQIGSDGKSNRPV